MLADKKLKPFITVAKPDKATSFYFYILGLKLISDDKYALEFDANETSLRVTIVTEQKRHPFTVLRWHVDDISSAVQSLNEKGIVF